MINIEIIAPRNIVHVVLPYLSLVMPASISPMIRFAFPIKNISDNKIPAMMSVPIPNVPAPNITATTDNPKRYCIAK
jgi:hypothetical protein